MGQVSVDHGGDLVFPPVRPVPGIYRFTISDGPEPVAEYIGQAAVSLVTRFGLYRSRGKKPSLPLASKTTSRNARHLLDALASGHSVSVALVDEHVTAPDGQVKMFDLADKTLRDGLERKLIAWLCTTGAEVLNRDFNPSWGGAAGKPRPQNDIEPVAADEVIHREYLPFTPRQLSQHFAPVTAMGDHLAYYRASAKRAADFKASPPAGTPAEMRQAIKWGRQMEKDERFWVAAALMQLFHAPDRIDLFARVLRHCLGEAPPDSLPSWEAALGEDQFLYFEANLPSPAGYSRQLGPHLDEHILVPYLREAAERTMQRGEKLEGPTKVDALLTRPRHRLRRSLRSQGSRRHLHRRAVRRPAQPDRTHHRRHARTGRPSAAAAIRAAPRPDMLCPHHSRDLPQEPREPAVRVAAACLPARPGSPATPSPAQAASRTGVRTPAPGLAHLGGLQPAAPWHLPLASSTANLSPNRPTRRACLYAAFGALSALRLPPPEGR